MRKFLIGSLLIVSGPLVVLVLYGFPFEINGSSADLVANLLIIVLLTVAWMVCLPFLLILGGTIELVLEALRDSSRDLE